MTNNAALRCGESRWGGNHTSQSYVYMCSCVVTSRCWGCHCRMLLSCWCDVEHSLMYCHSGQLLGSCTLLPTLYIILSTITAAVQSKHSQWQAQSHPQSLKYVSLVYDHCSGQSKHSPCQDVLPFCCMYSFVTMRSVVPLHLLSFMASLSVLFQQWLPILDSLFKHVVVHISDCHHAQHTCTSAMNLAPLL